MHQFYSLSDDMEGVNPLKVEKKLELASYFFTVNLISKKNREICHRMRKPSGLKVRLYASRLIALNNYLDLFPGETLSEKN